MRVFVTGGAGFIGSHLCAELLGRGWQVTAFDNLSLGKKEFIAPLMENKDFQFVQGDLLDLETLPQHMGGHNLVFHLAANSDILQGSRHTDVDLKQGTLATYNVLESMRKTDVKQLVFASTSAIYGEATVKPTPENYGPLMPISLYGASKLACEVLCSAFAHNFSMQAWVYRFANIVGSHATHGAIYDFVNKLKATPNELQVLGNGSQRKSYLHVTDCVDGLLFGYEKSNNEMQIFNLASHGVTEVKQIADAVVARVNPKAQIVYGSEDRGWKGDVPYTWLDGGGLAKLGWRAEHESTAALNLAVDEIVRELT